MGKNAPVTAASEERGNGEEESADSPAIGRRDTLPFSCSTANRDDGEDFRMGSVQAVIRSDLLITHGYSDGDTLYLIRREETREAEDFWLKIDKARRGRQLVRELPRPRGLQLSHAVPRLEYSGAHAVGLEAEPPKNPDKQSYEYAASTAIRASTGESEAGDDQHIKAFEVPIPGTDEVTGIRACREEERGELLVSRSFQCTGSRELPGKIAEDSASRCRNQGSSRSKRALPHLRGARGSDYHEHDGATASDVAWMKPQMCADKLGGRQGSTCFPEKICSEKALSARASSDPHDKDYSDFAITSVRVPSELERQPRRHHPGGEAEVDGPGAPCHDSEDDAQTGDASPRTQQRESHSPPAAETETFTLAVPPSPLGAVAARAGLKVQDGPTDRANDRASAASDPRALQVPHVIVTEAESKDQAPLWTALKHALQRASTQGPLLSTASPVAKAADTPAVVRGHETEGQKTKRTPAWASGLHRQEAVRPQKEYCEIHWPRSAERAEREQLEPQRLSFILQHRGLSRNEEQRGGRSVRPLKPWEQQQQQPLQRNFGKQQDNEGQQPPVELQGSTNLVNFLTSKSMAGTGKSSEEGPDVSIDEARESSSLKQQEGCKVAFKHHAALGSVAEEPFLDSKQPGQQADRAKRRWINEEVNCVKEREDTALADQRGVRAHRIALQSRGNREQCKGSVAVRKRIQLASERARAWSDHSFDSRADEETELRSGSPLTNFVRRCHSAETPTQIEKTPAGRYAPDSKLQGFTTVSDSGLFLSAALPHRHATKTPVDAERSGNAIHAGTEREWANFSKAGELTALPAYCYAKGNGVEKGAHSPRRGAAIETGSARRLRTQQQLQLLGDGWLFFRQPEFQGSSDYRMGGSTARASVTSRTEIGACGINEAKTPSSCGGTATMAAEARAKRRIAEGGRQAMRGRLQGVGPPFEGPCSEGIRPERQRVRPCRQTRAQVGKAKMTSVERSAWHRRSSGGQRSKCGDLRAQRDSQTGRRLRTMMPGRDHCGDELTQLWLEDSVREAVSECSNNSETKSELVSSTRTRKLEALCRFISAGQHPANPCAAEEESLSQSSGGTFRGWVSIEKPAEGDEGDSIERRFVGKQDLSAFGTRQHWPRDGGCLAGVPVNRAEGVPAESSSPVARAGTQNFASAVPSEASGRGGTAGSSCSSFKSHKGSGSTSSRRKAMRTGGGSASPRKGGDWIDSGCRASILRALSNCSKPLEGVKDGREAHGAKPTCPGEPHSEEVYRGGRMTRQIDGDGGITRAGAYYPTEAASQEQHIEGEPRGVASDSSLSSESYRAGWETLDTDTVFPTRTVSMRFDGVETTHCGAGDDAQNVSTAHERGATGRNVRPSTGFFVGKRTGGEPQANAGRCRRGTAAKYDHRDTDAEDRTRANAQAVTKVGQKSSAPEKEGEAGDRSGTAVLAFDRGASQSNGGSLLSFFGAATGWRYLKNAWQKHDEKETGPGEEQDADAMQSSEEKGIWETVSDTSSRVTAQGPDTIASAEDSAGKLSDLLAAGEARMTKRQNRLDACGGACRSQSSAGSKVDVRSRDGGLRTGAAQSLMARASDSRESRGAISSRQGSHSVPGNSRRSSVRRSRSAGVGSRGIESTSRHCRSSRIFHSTWRSACRSVRSDILMHTSSIRTNSKELDCREHADACGGSRRLYVTCGAAAARQAGSASKHLLRMSSHSARELMQVSREAPSRTRLTAKRGSSGPRTGRRRSCVVDVSERTFSLDGRRCRQDRVRRRRVDKGNLPSAKWKQAPRKAPCRVLRKDSGGDAADRRVHTSIDIRSPSLTLFYIVTGRRSECLRTVSLSSNACPQVRAEKSHYSIYSAEGEALQARIYKWPSWPPIRQSASAEGGTVLQTKPRLSPSFPGVYPFSPTAAHLFNTAPPASSADTRSRLGATPHPPAAAAAPLYASIVAGGGFMSSAHVSGRAGGRLRRALRSNPAAVPPQAARLAAAAAVAQATFTMADGPPGNPLLTTSSYCDAASNTHGQTDSDNGRATAARARSPFWCRWPAAALRLVGLPLRTVIRLLGLNVSGAYDRWRAEIRQRSLRGFLTLCLLDGVVCAAAVWAVCRMAVFVTRGAFKTAYLHVHNIDADRTSHYFDGLTYRFWGKRPLYFTDDPLLGAGHAADAEIATDPWSGLYHLQQRGIAWYQHHMYGDL